MIKENSNSLKKATILSEKAGEGKNENKLLKQAILLLSVLQQTFESLDAIIQWEQLQFTDDFQTEPGETPKMLFDCKINGFICIFSIIDGGNFFVYRYKILNSKTDEIIYAPQLTDSMQDLATDFYIETQQYYR